MEEDMIDIAQLTGLACGLSRVTVIDLSMTVTSCHAVSCAYLFAMSDTCTSAIANSRSFSDFPWQNGTILHLGSLLKRVQEWIDADRSRLDNISEHLVLVSPAILIIKYWLIAHRQGLVKDLESFDIDKHFKNEALVKEFVHRFLKASREEIMLGPGFPNIGPKSMTSAVHLVYRHKLVDVLFHALGFPPNEQRRIFARTYVGKIPEKLTLVSPLMPLDVLVLLTSVASGAQPQGLDVPFPRLEKTDPTPDPLSRSLPLCSSRRGPRSIQYSVRRSTSAAA